MSGDDLWPCIRSQAGPDLWFVVCGPVLCTSNHEKFRGASEMTTCVKSNPRWHLITFTPFLQEKGTVHEGQGTGAGHCLGDGERADRDKRLRTGKRCSLRWTTPYRKGRS